MILGIIASSIKGMSPCTFITYFIALRLGSFLKASYTLSVPVKQSLSVIIAEKPWPETREKISSESEKELHFFDTIANDLFPDYTQDKIEEANKNLNKYKIIYFTASFLTVLSLIILKYHFLSDILSSIYLGSLISFFVYFSFKYFAKKEYTQNI